MKEQNPMNEKKEKMNFSDTLRKNKQARDQIVKSFAGFQATRATAEFCFFGAQDQDIKISANADEFVRGFNSITEAIWGNPVSNGET